MNANQDHPAENLQEGLSLHAQFLTREERQAELRERGIDVDAFLVEARSIIANRLKEERLVWMKSAKEKALTFQGERLIVSWLNKSQNEITAAFQNLVNTAKQTLAFRNKSELTVEDMACILDDYERLGNSLNEQNIPEKGNEPS